MFSTNGKVATRLDDKLLKRITKEAGVESFGWDDFRRTFSTHLNETPNADFIVIEACLNHTVEAQRGVAGVYNRAEYKSQKQAVLQRWSDIMEAAVG
jgi:integrase